MTLTIPHLLRSTSPSVPFHTAACVDETKSSLGTAPVVSVTKAMHAPRIAEAATALSGSRKLRAELRELGERAVSPHLSQTERDAAREQLMGRLPALLCMIERLLHAQARVSLEVRDAHAAAFSA